MMLAAPMEMLLASPFIIGYLFHMVLQRVCLLHHLASNVRLRHLTVAYGLTHSLICSLQVCLLYLCTVGLTNCRFGADCLSPLSSAYNSSLFDAVNKLLGVINVQNVTILWQYNRPGNNRTRQEDHGPPRQFHKYNS